jgi:anti-anti-sigma factor
VLELKTTVKTNGLARVALMGELTIYTAGQAKQEIPSQLAKHDSVELDLSGVEELDTAGVQVLLWLKRCAAAEGKHLPFVFHSAAVVAVFDLLDMGGMFGDPILLDSPAR